MTVLIIFIGITIGLNCIPLLIKKDFPKNQSTISKILIVSAVLSLVLIVLKLSGYQLKGIYSFPTIILTFIISTLLYFVLFKNSKRKLITVFLLTPLLMMSISNLLFGRTLKEFEINEKTKVTVTTGGFLSCGEILKFNQSRFGIFNKEIHSLSGLCLVGITKIETNEIDDKHTELLIYHDGIIDPENPFRYTMENKNVW